MAPNDETIDHCSICLQPAHASETDDLDRCPNCRVEDITLSLTLLDGGPVSYRLSVGECNDGSPWVGSMTRNGEECGWDHIVAAISRAQENGLSDAARFLLDAIARRVGLPEGWAICLVCCDSIKAVDAKKCPYSERDLCGPCYDSIESETPCVSQSIIRCALGEEAE